MKNCKLYYEAQTAHRFKEIIQPTPNHHPSTHTHTHTHTHTLVSPDKILLRLWSKIFFREI